MEDIILIESIYVVVQVHPCNVKHSQHCSAEHDGMPADSAVFYYTTALDHHPKVDYVNKDEHPITYPLLFFPLLYIRLLHDMVSSLLIPDNCC